MLLSVSSRFIIGWKEVEKHEHQLTFKQSNLATPTTLCIECNKECHNVRNLLEHKKFKHPHATASANSIDAATQMSPQTQNVDDDSCGNESFQQQKSHVIISDTE